MPFTMKQLCEHFDCERHLLEHAMRRDQIEADYREGVARMWLDSSLPKITAAVEGTMMRRPRNWQKFRHGARGQLDAGGRS